MTQSVFNLWIKNNIKNLDLDDIFKSYEWPENFYVNQNVKFKHGGRNAPRISMEEFKQHVNDVMDAYKKERGRNYTDFGEVICYIAYKNQKLFKDLHKIDVDAENWDTDNYGVTESGIPYIFTWGGSDGDLWVYYFIYWDGKQFRIYYPTAGNQFDRFNREAFGKDYEAGFKSLLKDCLPSIYKKFTDEDIDEWIEENSDYLYDFLMNDLESKIVYDEDLMIRDFESRLTVID
jgi:hypothetical protein